MGRACGSFSIPLSAFAILRLGGKAWANSILCGANVLPYSCKLLTYTRGACHYRRALMKIAIIGVTGRAGSRIAAEALRRGHSVTGIVRSPEKADVPDGVTVQKSDAMQPEQLTPRLRGHDAV